MAGQVRDLWLRVSVDGQLTATSAPVRIQQQLEGAVTTVAEISLASTTPALATNAAVTVHHVNRNLSPDPNYQSRQLFAGIVNRISGVGAPHGVTLSCTGALAQLRRTRPDEWAMTGLTDTQVVRAVLTYCGVPYSAADIRGWDYQLGMTALAGAADRDVHPTWRIGQSGAEIIGELDRVFGCATIELGDGRVVRFPYSLAPYQYVNPVYAKTFTRGQAGATFYSHERDRGDLDQIQNYWIVRGLSFTIGAGADEGCQYSLYAGANADHAALGAGVEVGRQEFSSDLIDSEALAKAIAIRLMHWHNREPDSIRIQCGNDARVGVGSLVLVRDPSYGIDLGSSKRYLITGVSREGDTMLLDGIGGPTGAVGSVRSHLVRACNDTSSELGTDPPAFGAPDPVLPDFPGLGDISPDLPPVEPPTGPPEDQEPFVDCTELDDGATGPVEPAGPPGVEPGGYMDPADMLSSNYRSAARVSYHVLPSGDVDYIALGDAGIVTVNETTPVASKTFANDRNMAAGPGVVTIAGEVWFQSEGAVLEVQVQGYGAGGGVTADLTAEALAKPGRVYTFTGAAGTEDDQDFHFGLFVDTEHTVYRYSPFGPPNQCDLLFRTCNNGGLAAEGGFPVGEWLPFAFAFDFSGEYQRVTYAVGSAGGYMEDLRSITVADGLPPEAQHYAVCDDPFHRLWLQATGTVADEDTLDPETWQVRVRDVAVGHSTCVPNPDYVPPAAEGF